MCTMTYRKMTWSDESERRRRKQTSKIKRGASWERDPCNRRKRGRKYNMYEVQREERQGGEN